MSDEKFREDQRVIFRRGGVQWFEGRIYSVNGEGESYAVQEFEACCEWGGIYAERNCDPVNVPGNVYEIPCGHDNIRFFPPEESITDRMEEAFQKPPIFEDPLAHLYMGDGEIELPPRKELEGLIDPRDFREMIKVVSNRRKRNEGSIYDLPANPLKTLHSILPKERDVGRLFELAKSDPSAMLQLADVHRFGLLGVLKSLEKARNMYMLSALGMNSEEFKSNPNYVWEFAYPMGTPEALTASAQEWWLLLCASNGAHDKEDYDSLVRHLKYQADTEEIEPLQWGLLKAIVCSLGHAIRRGWTSPFALKFAKPMRELEFIDSFRPDAMQFVNILECIKIQNTEQVNPNGRGVIPVGQGSSRPSDYQRECFVPKATEIFLGLPIESTVGRYGCPSDMHVEYREMAFPPYPIMVNVFNPQSRFFYEQIHLPAEYKYTPFSEEAFEYMWGNVVFSMHRGEHTGRFRPTIITFADKPGDRLFASFVKRKVGGDACGTKIQIINTNTYKMNFMGNTSSVQEIQDKHDNDVAIHMRRGFDLHHFETLTEQPSRGFNNRTEIPVEELCSKVERLKQEGNEFFNQERLQPAKRCYTEAITCIQANAHLNNNTYLLLGTLLCNRAACFLKLAEGMSLDSSKTILKKALFDCDNALESKPCMRVLPSRIKTKLEKRKEIATSKLDHLISQSSSFTMSSRMNHREPNQQQAQLAPRSQRHQRHQRQRKKKTKKGRRKQKQKLRRRQRQRNRDAEQSNHSDSDEESDDEEDDRELISIATGKELWESKITPFVNGREDTCPCCVDRFSVELEGIFCAVNPCGHAYCLPCLSKLKKNSQKRSNSLDFNCPVCRVPIDKDVLSDAVDPIISCTETLQERIASLPLRELECNQITEELLMRHDFRIPDVLSTLDAMLTDGLQASLRASSDLTPSQKQEIYEKARKPVDDLWAEANDLRSRMDLVYDFESESYQNMKKRLAKLQHTLIPAATKAAVDFIWERMNSAGSMGVQDALSGEIEIDFHALHVNEAIERFNEQVVPILPAVDSILLVVGRGNHSEGGSAKLKPALKKHIEKHATKMRHSRVEGNEGMIRVRWKH